MTERGADLGEADIPPGAHHRLHHLVRARGVKSPIRGERHHQATCLYTFVSRDQVAAIVSSRIEVVQQSCHQQIAVGVETVDERRTLVAQITFNLKVGVEVEGQLSLAQLATKFLAHAVFGQIGDVAEHACQHQAAPRYQIVVEIVPVVKFRIRANCLARYLVEGNILC